MPSYQYAISILEPATKFGYEGTQMGGRNEDGRSASFGRVAVTTFAIVLGILTCKAHAASPGMPAKDKRSMSVDATQTYQHTFDEVFQAAQETIERMGCFATGADKDTGMITGNGLSRGAPGYTFHVEFEIHIEVVSAKPETRVRVSTKCKPATHTGPARNFNDDFLAGLQKLLVTYK